MGHITGGHRHSPRRCDCKARAGSRPSARSAPPRRRSAAALRPAAAIAVGAGQAANRNALSHSRAEEASADQAGLRYLAAAGSDPEAMLQVLDHFRGQDAILGGGYADPYVQNHPLWSERIALIEDRIAKMPPGSPPSAEDVYWHARMVAKLDAFLDSPAQTLREYPPSDTSEPALLARAVACIAAPTRRRRRRRWTTR